MGSCLPALAPASAIRRPGERCLIMKRLVIALPLLAALVCSIALVASGGRSSLALSGTTERVSVDSAGNEGNGHSDYPPAISADGRYVAFNSRAFNLVPGDTNGKTDVFVHDRQTGVTERVSVDSAGEEDNGGLGGRVYPPAITPDGRYVAFSSTGNNLVPGDTNQCFPFASCPDVFVHDRQTGVTERVSVDSAGNQGNTASYAPTISTDGRYVAFESLASNLVPGDTFVAFDIFVHDRQTGATTLVSVDSAGNGGNASSFDPAMSADGRYVAFYSRADNLLSDDTNGADDVFVHDRQTGATTRVSVDSAGNQGNGGSYGADISADGRYVAFDSRASNLVPGDTNSAVDVFVHDRQNGITERVSVDSEGNEGYGFYAAISGDGRYVAFASWASSNLVPDGCTGYPDCLEVFIHERQTGTTARVSVDSGGNPANDDSRNPAMSADGRYVAFASWADNLVPGDTNGSGDVFVRDRGGQEPPLCGDVDCDDAVDAVDALFILQYVVGTRQASDQCPPPEGHLYLPAGDVDCDDDVDAVDALFVLQHVVGLRPELCPGP